MKIIIYGAAGIVGRGVRRVLAGKHDLVLVDRAPIVNPEGRSVVGDVGDPELFRNTAPGADVLVYLPYAPYKIEDECNSAEGASFDVNTRGVYYCLAAAKEFGVPRVVYTSTLSVFAWSEEVLRGLREESPPSPDSRYGLTKWFGEEVCRYFARHYGITPIVLRLCLVRDPADWDRRTPSSYGYPQTHADDVGRAVELSLTAPLSGFQLMHIFGERFRTDWTDERARTLLGFVPAHV